MDVSLLDVKINGTRFEDAEGIGSLLYGDEGPGITAVEVHEALGRDFTTRLREDGMPSNMAAGFSLALYLVGIGVITVE